MISPSDWKKTSPVEGWVCDTELKRLLQAHNELGVDIVTLDDEEDDEPPAEEPGELGRRFQTAPLAGSVFYP
jgi:hypothetical protein